MVDVSNFAIEPSAASGDKAPAVQTTLTPDAKLGVYQIAVPMAPPAGAWKLTEESIDKKGKTHKPKPFVTVTIPAMTLYVLDAEGKIKVRLNADGTPMLREGKPVPVTLCMRQNVVNLFFDPASQYVAASKASK